MRIPPSLRPRFLLGSGDLQNVLKAASLGPRSRKKQFATFNQAFLVDMGGKRFIAMTTGLDIGVPANAPRMKGTRLLYVLVPSVRIIPRLHMRDSVQATVAKEFNAAFARRMADAIRTAH